MKKLDYLKNSKRELMGHLGDHIIYFIRLFIKKIILLNLLVFFPYFRFPMNNLATLSVFPSPAK